MRTGIYCRISQDATLEGLGVERQKKDSEALAVKRGWAGDLQYYIDNDVSASSGKARPEFQRMLADVRSGAIQNLIVWSVDRLTRTPLELETLIGLADAHGLSLATVTGETDLSTSTGRLVARLLGNAARFEVEQTSLRLKRKFLQKAEMGEPHGYPPYGFKRVQSVDDGGLVISRIKRDVVHEVHGPIVQEAAKRVLALESLRSVAADLTRRGVPGPQSAVWSAAVLRQILVRPTNAGLRQYQGVVVGKATTEPLYSEDVHNRLLALLTDPARKSNFAGSEFRYLLGGIALCGLCGGRMRRQIGRTVVSKRTGTIKRQPSSYCCASCFKVRRRQEPVDELIVGLVCGRLAMPDAVSVFAVGNSEMAIQAQDEIENIDARLATVADQFVAGLITGEQLGRISLALQNSRLTLVRRLQGATPRTHLTELVGGDVQGKWDQLTVGAQRDIISELMTITIHKAGSGKRFDPDLIVVDWKHEAVRPESGE